MQTANNQPPAKVAEFSIPAYLDFLEDQVHRLVDMNVDAGKDVEKIAIDCIDAFLYLKFELHQDFGIPM